MDSSKDAVMPLLVCCEWVHICYYDIARVFWMVAIVLLCGCLFVVGMLLLGCCGGLPMCCYVVARVLCRVAKALHCYY